MLRKFTKITSQHTAQHLFFNISFIIFSYISLFCLFTTAFNVTDAGTLYQLSVMHTFELEWYTYVRSLNFFFCNNSYLSSIFISIIVMLLVPHSLFGIRNIVSDYVSTLFIREQFLQFLLIIYIFTVGLINLY